MPHSITEERQRVAWVYVNPKSIPSKDSEKQKETTRQFFWRKPPSDWKRRRLWQRLQGVQTVVNNQHPNATDQTVTLIIYKDLWRRVPLQGTKAEIRSTQSRTIDHQSLPSHSDHAHMEKTRTPVDSTQETVPPVYTHTQILYPLQTML